MKALTVQDVRRLVRSVEFAEWRDRHMTLREELEKTHGQSSDQVLHTVWRAGELEDLSARAHIEFLELDHSFEALSAFEAQRQKAADLRIELHQAEKLLEDHRQSASELRQKIEARKKGRRMTANVDEFERRQSELGDLESLIDGAARDADTIRRRFDGAISEREEMWAQVETQWTEAFCANMARAEYAYMARRERLKIEQHPGGAEGGRVEGEPSVADAELNRQLEEIESKIAASAMEAEERFGCILIAEFCYWPRQDDVRAAFCVPLIAERDALNVQVEPMHIYEVERARGIDFVAPVPEEHEESDDPRLDSFFVEGRPTHARPG